MNALFGALCRSTSTLSSSPHVSTGAVRQPTAAMSWPISPDGLDSWSRAYPTIRGRNRGLIQDAGLARRRLRDTPPNQRNDDYLFEGRGMSFLAWLLMALWYWL